MASHSSGWKMSVLSYFQLRLRCTRNCILGPPLSSSLLYSLRWKCIGQTLDIIADEHVLLFLLENWKILKRTETHAIRWIAKPQKNLFSSTTYGQMVIDCSTRECFIRKVLHSSAFNTHARFQSVLRDYSIVAWKQVYNAVASLIHKQPEHLRDDDDDLCIFALPVHVPIPLAFLRR